MMRFSGLMTKQFKILKERMSGEARASAHLSGLKSCWRRREALRSIILHPRWKRAL